MLPNEKHEFSTGWQAAQKRRAGRQAALQNWPVGCTLTLWRSLRFGDFRKKKRLNACGFAQEFLQSGMLYRPSKSLKRRNKSSSLHSKKIFWLGGAGFLQVTS